MDTILLNSEFGVGEIASDEAVDLGCASSPDFSVPHFFRDTMVVDEAASTESWKVYKAPAAQDPNTFVPEAYLPQTQAPILPRSINPWPPQLIVELALQLHDLDTILARYDMDEAHYTFLLTNPVFRKEVALMMRELSENGHSFRVRARMQAEAYLDIVDDIVNDIGVAASIRLDGIKSMVAWGDLVPKEKKGEGEGAPTVNIQINY